MQSNPIILTSIVETCPYHQQTAIYSNVMQSIKRLWKQWPDWLKRNG